MNRQALIIGPTGRNLFRMGGDLAWQTFHSGGYTVSIEWDQDGRTCEPIMLIWSQQGGRAAGAFGICLSSIGKYAEVNGRPTREAVLEVLRALPVLGRAKLDAEVHQLLDIIIRHTPDLIRCPPAPPSVRRAEVGEPLVEMTAKDANGRVINESVL